jgi:serine/threonine protein kinase
MPVDVSFYSRSSGAQRALIGLLQRDAQVLAALDRLQDMERHDTVVHGDLRAENVLRSSAGSLHVVDWELCRWGDRRAEIGYFLGNLVYRRLYAHRSSAASVDAWRESVNEVLLDLHMFCSAFWLGHASVARVGPAREGEGFRDFAWRSAGAVVLGQLLAACAEFDSPEPRFFLIAEIARGLILDRTSVLTAGA